MQNIAEPRRLMYKLVQRIWYSIFYTIQSKSEKEILQPLWRLVMRKWNLTVCVVDIHKYTHIYGLYSMNNVSSHDNWQGIFLMLENTQFQHESAHVFMNFSNISCSVSCLLFCFIDYFNRILKIISRVLLKPWRSHWIHP